MECLGNAFLSHMGGGGGNYSFEVIGYRETAEGVGVGGGNPPPTVRTFGMRGYTKTRLWVLYKV